MAASKRYALINKEKHNLLDRTAYVFATGAGAGFAPIASGTFGALEGVALFMITSALPLTTQQHLILLLALSAFTFFAGVWASSRACDMFGLKDPGPVVIDEVCGQLISFIPLALTPSIPGVVLAFFLFRLFDIFKPYPIYKLEALPSGLGVMSDDVLAGVYTAVLVWLAVQ
jgi:phosphatidylglycerophosphatase A